MATDITTQYEDDDIAVYSKAFYMQYAQGDPVFAEFLQLQDEEKAERNRKLLTFVVAGETPSWNSVKLPENMWRSVVYRDWPQNKRLKGIDSALVVKPENEDDEDGEFEQGPPPTEQHLSVPEKTEEERTAEVLAQAELAAEQSSKEQDERQREIDQRAEMRRKCCQSAQARCWGYKNWSEVESVQGRKRMRTSDGTGVPSLRELAEIALQKAFEMRGEDLQLPEEMRRLGYMITPVAMNDELCRIIRSRPAIE